MLQYRKPADAKAAVPWQPPAADKPLEGQKKLKPKTYEEIRELVRAEAKQKLTR